MKKKRRKSYIVKKCPVNPYQLQYLGFTGIPVNTAPPHRAYRAKTHPRLLRNHQGQASFLFARHRCGKLHTMANPQLLGHRV
jgi:hypothetical protein